jgi:hypothetical protein
MADSLRLFISLYTDEDITNELAPALRDRGLQAQSAAEAGLLNFVELQTPRALLGAPGRLCCWGEPITNG